MGTTSSDRPPIESLVAGYNISSALLFLEKKKSILSALI
jgi:hypothetical protein